MKKEGENEKESPGKQRGANKDTIFFCRESTLLVFPVFFLLQQSEGFTPTVANHMLGF